jgi:peptidoglycan pentaglycine glycine transferase (the first glycine)
MAGVGHVSSGVVTNDPVARSADLDAGPHARGGGNAPGALRLVDATSWLPGAWDALAVRSPGGEALQSHAWGEQKRPLGWDVRRLVIELGGEAAAVASIQERGMGDALPGAARAMLAKVGPLASLRYLYAPRGPVLLRRDAVGVRAALHGLRRFARARRALVLAIDPAWEEGGDLAAELGRSRFAAARREIQVSRTAMLVPIERDEDAQHRLLGDSTARNINKARRTGVTVERIDLVDVVAADPALAEFWDMFVATGRREGFIVRDRAYQLTQWQSLGAAGLASLWFARADGRRQTGVVLLHAGERLVSHHAGSPDDADLRGTRANHLLQWEIIRWAAGAGFTTYDLGGVDTRDAPGLPDNRSHPLWNLYEFKRGFGARGVVLVRAHEHAPHASLALAWNLARRLR